MNVIDEIRKSSIHAGGQMIDGMMLPEAAEKIALFCGNYKRQYVVETWREGSISDGQAIALLWNMGFRGKALDPTWMRFA